MQTILYIFENDQGNLATITLTTARGYISVSGEIFDRADRIPGETSRLNSRGQRRWCGECGQCQDTIFAEFPVPADHPARLANQFHLADIDKAAPMHYVANSLFHAGKSRRHFSVDEYYPSSLEKFRRAACWPEATQQDMETVTEQVLLDRLPPLSAKILEVAAMIERLATESADRAA
jgi:hypothetical protein